MSSAFDVKTSLWSFLLRVALIATVLAVPVLGTSFALVSQINRDLALARTERTALANFDRFRMVFVAVDGLRGKLEQRDRVAAGRAREAVDRTLARAERTYRPSTSETRAFWTRVDASWSSARSSPTTARLDAVLDALGEAGNTFEGDSALDQDPNVAVLNVADVFLRKAPRSIVAMSETRDAVALEREHPARLDVLTAERISARRAIEQQAVTVGFSDIDLAMSIEPQLRERFATLLQTAQARTQSFNGEVDAVLSQRTPIAHSRQRVRTAANRAMTAQFALWQHSGTEADRFVRERLAGQVVRRSVIVAFACLAILAGALAVSFISRYEARRDRVELRSAKLESDRLRADVERISIERDLRIREEQFRVIFENADLGIATFDRDGISLQCNAAARQMLGTETEAVLARQVETVRTFQAVRCRPLTREEGRSKDDGGRQWLAFTFSGVYDENICQLVILLIRDTTEETLLARQLAYDARHDCLTGLMNRAAFDHVMREARAGIDFAPFALMYVDLDKFKPVNDSFGHRAGDHVLVTTAERLRGAVGAQDTCARLGGDEFAILLRGVDSAAAIELIAERLAASVAMPIVVPGGAILSVTASIGVAIGSTCYASLDELKHDADLALYAVKERGRNGFLIDRRFAQEARGIA